MSILASGILTTFYMIFMPVLLLANLGLSIACTVMLSKVRLKQEEVQHIAGSTKTKQVKNNGEILQSTSELQNKYEISKTGIGVGLAFLGLIGLIIGICLYPERTKARETFMKGWVITFFILLASSFVLGFGIYFLIISLFMPKGY